MGIPSRSARFASRRRNGSVHSASVWPPITEAQRADWGARAPGAVLTTTDRSPSRRTDVVKLSALVCARDQEADLSDCLRRLWFCDEIVVVADRCTDASAEIARRHGA